MKKRVATLKGPMLAYWVAKALRKTPSVATENVRGRWHCIVGGQTFQPASDPALIVALLDGERITLDRDLKGKRWVAVHPRDALQIGGQAPDLATAVLRAFVVGIYGRVRATGGGMMRTQLQALGSMKAGAMNKTEQAYAATLELRRTAGEVAWFKFEGLKFRLADNTFFTPDFIVMLASGHLECHEVKGFWQDDARAKIKIAADMYPFRFLAVKARSKRDGGGWAVEDFS